MRNVGVRASRGALSAMRAQCNYWASGRTRDPCFEILGASLLPRGVGFDAFSTLGIWHFWIFTHFHPFPPLFTFFCSSPPHPLFSRRERKYGHDEILLRKHLFRFFFFLKHTPPHRCAHLFSGATGCSEEAWWASVHRVRSYLNGVVAEIRWAERLSGWNHVPHFPYFVTHYVDSMPIASIGGILCDALLNPKYAGCVYKVTVAVDSLGNIVWICGAVWVT